MNTRHGAGLLAFAIVLTAGAQALALDAYRDRRGLFGGISLGAGSGKADVASGNDSTAKGSLGDDSHIGYNVRARLGGGITQTLTLDAEIGFHLENYDVANIDVSTSLMTIQLGANFFVFDGLYVRGMGGVASITSEFEGRNKRDEETGVTVGAGLGYEFFANADLAVGVGFDYQLAMFSDVPDFTTINFGVTATWY